MKLARGLFGFDQNFRLTNLYVTIKTKWVQVVLAGEIGQVVTKVVALVSNETLKATNG